MTAVAAPHSKLSRHAVLWVLKSVVIDRLSIAHVAAGRQLLIDYPGRPDGVRVLGVDEHAWCHTRRGD